MLESLLQLLENPWDAVPERPGVSTVRVRRLLRQWRLRAGAYARPGAGAARSQSTPSSAAMTPASTAVGGSGPTGIASTDG
jgi:hypothetical protein